MKIKIAIDFILNNGLKYIFFRIYFLIKSKLGIDRIIFPTNPKKQEFISLNDWKSNLPPYFFYGKKIKSLQKKPIVQIKNEFDDLKKGIFCFFNNKKINLGKDYDWVTNPINNYKFNINKHWSQINDFSEKSGDIKYVWEKARFSFIYDLIIYDYNFEEDQSEFVFKEIIDFIDKNPINFGPNYKCSQEISVRIFNWVFALYFYKDSINLSEEIFSKILNSIYWQVHHVYHNINFSRFIVRNNHALSETLLLYFSSKLFPFFPNVKKWGLIGKKYFEKEIIYQIYPDGTFLQFSMNYHRIVIQLLTLAIQIAKINNESFNNLVYERAKKSLNFLDTCLDIKTGNLPNYGLNDGSLFFKLNNDDYRDYRSQLDDLRAVLYGYTNYDTKTCSWYGIKPKNKKNKSSSIINTFDYGGYYILNEGNTKTFIRCGSYDDRPHQSDNLHLDIWVDGNNILRDNGSYGYNTELKYIKYFNGCEGHNTASISGEDQMLKGTRFIWFFWVKSSKAKLYKKNGKFYFEGEFTGFRHIGKNINHKRIVSKYVDKNEWLVRDEITGVTGKVFSQYWHLSKNNLNSIQINCLNNNSKIEPLIEEKWYSNSYGKKEKSMRYEFKNNLGFFNTSLKYIK